MYVHSRNIKKLKFLTIQACVNYDLSHCRYVEKLLVHQIIFYLSQLAVFVFLPIAILSCLFIA